MSIHALPTPTISPVQDRPISSTTKNSIRTVMNTTESRKFLSVSRGLKIEYFRLMIPPYLVAFAKGGAPSRFHYSTLRPPVGGFCVAIP